MVITLLIYYIVPAPRALALLPARLIAEPACHHPAMHPDQRSAPVLPRGRNHLHLPRLTMTKTRQPCSLDADTMTAVPITETANQNLAAHSQKPAQANAKSSLRWSQKPSSAAPPSPVSQT